MLKLSARNQFPGKILEVKRGATTTHVRIEVASGVVFTASITNESAEELKLAAGGKAIAVVKASDVMVGTEG
jgi:molybdopterin-binding protein